MNAAMSRNGPASQGDAGQSWASSSAVRRSMQGNRSRDTSPELAVRSLLHARGWRYRVSRRPIRAVRRTADLVFGPARVAVFVDGCFWHGCPDHFVPPKTNPGYWNEKIGGNRRRDAETDRLLREHGWLPLRFWEHEEPEAVADIVAQAVREADPRR